MALFRKKETAKENEANTAPAKQTAKPAVKKGSDVPQLRDLASVIKKPRITEKAVFGTEKGVYTFEVRADATKHDVRAAVESIFKVTPVKINIVNKKPRTFMSRMRGRKMSESGLKKAYVYLKEGDTINLV